MSDQAKDDWIMTVDVGAHRILANHVLQCRTPGQLMQSNGLGCMGYAVPAAIGLVRLIRLPKRHSRKKHRYDLPQRKFVNCFEKFWLARTLTAKALRTQTNGSRQPG